MLKYTIKHQIRPIGVSRFCPDILSRRPAKNKVEGALFHNYTLYNLKLTTCVVVE
jgi:hypothetical protein